MFDVLSATVPSGNVAFPLVNTTLNFGASLVLPCTFVDVRVLILPSSYSDLVKAGNKFPFRPGMTASVDIMTTTKNDALSVPLASVTTRNPEQDKKEEENNQGPNSNARQTSDQTKPKKQAEDKTVIFVNENGVAKMVEVKTGISDYDNIEILSGVSEGAEIISGPFTAVSKRLKDGDKVRQAEKKEPEKKNDN